LTTCDDNRVGFAFGNPDITNDYHAPSWGLLVSPDELRYDELFGNALIAESDSQIITDDQLLDYSRLAIGYLERELNIDILPRRIRYEDPIGEDGNVVERTDYDDTSYLSKMDRKQQQQLYIKEIGYPYRVIAARKECFIKLRRRPVRDLLNAKFVDPYFSNEIINLMPYRIVKKNFGGICFFRPRAMRAYANSYSFFWHNFFTFPYYRDVHNVFLIDYETGFENCQDVPDDIRNIVKKISAVTLMNIYGDGKLAAIASRSVNLNSVSESINTTLSATSATFGARIMQYQKEIKEWLGQNKSKFSRTTFGRL
jgi:hypothetical protein